MAEREGFEPPVPVKVRLISSQVHSTGLCHLSVWCGGLALKADASVWARVVIRPPLGDYCQSSG